MSYSASQKELVIVVKPDGAIEITTKGIKGPECKPVLEKFARHLGEVKHEERTSEWYETSTTQTHKIHLDGSIK
jgi:hypothetical protein